MAPSLAPTPWTQSFPVRRAPVAARPTPVSPNGPRDVARRRRLHLPDLRSARARHSGGDTVDAGGYHYSVDALVEEAHAVYADGIPAMLLFGLPAAKDELAPRRTRRTRSFRSRCGRSKTPVPDLMVVTDVCLCEYTDHGHCGVIRGDTSTMTSVALLVRTAVTHAGPAPTSSRRPT